MTLLDLPPSPPPPGPDGASGDDPSVRPESEEAAWLRAGPAAHSRLGARMWRVSVVGAAAGGVGLAAVVFLVHATDLLRNLFVSTYTDGTLALFANVLTGAAAALFAWLLFYSLRLSTRSGRLTPRGATDNLRKLRVVACPLLVVSLALLAIGVSREEPLAEAALPVMGLLTSAVCCYVLVSLRRAAWDVALIEGASVARPGDTRGFSVLTAAPAFPAAAVIAPAFAAAPPAPTSANDAVPKAPARVLPLSAEPAADPALSWDEGSSFRDWETLLMALAVAAIGLHLFHTPMAVRFAAAVVYHSGDMWQIFLAAFGSGNLGLSAADAWVILLMVASSLCATAWVLWGVLTLAAGPRIRRTTMALAAVTLCLRAGILAVYLVHLAGSPSSLFPSLYRSGFAYSIDSILEAGPLTPGVQQLALGSVLPVMLMFVITRRPAKELFSRKLRRPLASARRAKV